MVGEVGGLLVGFQVPGPEWGGWEVRSTEGPMGGKEEGPRPNPRQEGVALVDPRGGDLGGCPQVDGGLEEAEGLAQTYRLVGCLRECRHLSCGRRRRPPL